MKLKESGENYLENIYILQKRNGSVRYVDLAREMDFSKPSVSRAIHLLEDEGYLKIEDSGNLRLSESGLEVAKRIYERHVFFSSYLMALGVDEDTAVTDACLLEHDISSRSFDAMKEHLSKCMSCEHFNNDEHFLKYNNESIRRNLEKIVEN